MSVVRFREGPYYRGLFLEEMYENDVGTWETVGIREVSVWRGSTVQCTVYILYPSNISSINFTIPLLIHFPNFMFSNCGSLHFSINKPFYFSRIKTKKTSANNSLPTGYNRVFRAEIDSCLDFMEMEIYTNTSEPVWYKHQTGMAKFSYYRSFHNI